MAEGRAKKQILVIDDEEDLVDLLEVRLQAAGYKMLRAYDGEEGLEVVAANIPDLIILDISMPKMDGYQVCEKLKSNRKLKKVPVIMLTAMGQRVDVIVGKALGADAYISKPFNHMELLAKIEELMS